jgi:hypothetical protein
MKTSFSVWQLRLIVAAYFLVSPHGIHAQYLREYIHMGGRVVAVENSSCPTITGTASFDTSSHTGTLTVTAPAGCAWSVSSDQSWLTITSGASGSGNGTITFSLSANTTGLERVAYLSGLGPPFPITQYTALRFMPVTPCRVADTRGATGTFGGPQMAGQTSRDFPIPAGSCGIPSSAEAYAVNISVVPPGTLGYLTAWPSGQPRPARPYSRSHRFYSIEPTI